MRSLKSLIERELASADAVAFDQAKGDRSLHGPTVDHFKGQTLAYRKVLSFLEMDKISPAAIKIEKRIDVRFTWGWLALAAACVILGYVL